MLNRRFRLLAALVAIFAFSASLAQGVWTSSGCAEMGSMGAGASSAMAPMPAMAPAGEHATDPAAPIARPDPAEASGAAPAGAPSCPLLSLLGDCVAVSLPSAEPSSELVSAPPIAAVARATLSPDLLLATSLLRPPKA